MLAGYASKDGEGSNHEGSPDTLNRRKTIGFLENKRRDTFNEPDQEESGKIEVKDCEIKSQESGIFE